MYLLLTVLSVLYSKIECANYDRYETTYRSPSSTLYNTFYKTGSYNNDMAPFPAVTRYPNYSPTTNRYPNSYQNGYSTNNYDTLYSGGSSNVNYNQGYNSNFGRSGYGNSGFGNSGFGNSGFGNTGLPGYTTYEEPFMRDLGSCVNRSPQQGIWVDSLMGMWFGVELIQHLGMDSRVDYTQKCIVVHIAEPREEPSTEHQLHHVQHINARFRQEHRHLRLLWDENGQTIDYSLYFKNDSAGYWHVLDGQNGSMTNLPSYKQFSGTVQVLKAVSDHLVLNFCQEGINGRSGQLYSVLLSRNPGDMNRWEIDAIHSLLQTKKLSVASRRMVCGNNGVERPLHSLMFSFLTCLLAYVVAS